MSSPQAESSSCGEELPSQPQPAAESSSTTETQSSALQRRKDLHNIISERQRRYTETVLAMGGQPVPAESEGSSPPAADVVDAVTDERLKPVMVSVSQAVCKQNEKFIIKRLKVKMANCFDFRNRTTSFDLHHIGQGTKMSLLSKLFRSKSDSNMKPSRSPRQSPGTSPRTSPKSSPGAPPKRRFMRVVRDSSSEGEEYHNPHVVRRYNPGFWEKQYMLQKSQSLEERPLPYTVTGHTILKKHHSFEENQAASASNSPTYEKKHATFKEVVEVVEYHPKTRCKLILEDSCIVREKLHDDWEECLDVEYQVPRNEGDKEVDEVASCKAILDIVLDEVSRNVPLEQIKEGDDEGCDEYTGSSSHAMMTSSSRTSPMMTGGASSSSEVEAMEQDEGAVGGAAAGPVLAAASPATTAVASSLSHDKDCSSSSAADIITVEAKRSKLETTVATRSEP